MKWRFATTGDYRMLAEMNHQLIKDEGHRNPMSIPQLEERMRRWLRAGEYQAIVFEDKSGIVAYALFRETAELVYLRQLFVIPQRRREGIGRRAMQDLFAIWPRHKRWTVSVLVKNTSGVAFWRAMGYTDYELTLEIMPKNVHKTS